MTCKKDGIIKGNAGKGQSQSLDQDGRMKAPAQFKDASFLHVVFDEQYVVNRFSVIHVIRLDRIKKLHIGPSSWGTSF